MKTLFEDNACEGITKITVGDPLGRGEYLSYLVTVECNKQVPATDVAAQVERLVRQHFRDTFGSAQERVECSRKGSPNRDFPNDSMWEVQVWP